MSLRQILDKPYAIKWLSQSFAICSFFVLAITLLHADADADACKNCSVGVSDSANLNDSSSYRIDLETNSRSGFIPTSIAIESLGISSSVEPGGTVWQYDPFLERSVWSFSVPTNMRYVTWWSDGPRPGGKEMAILLGHTEIGGGYGIFNDIRELKYDENVSLIGDDGSVMNFQVREVVKGIDKRDYAALSNLLEYGSGRYRLALITCGDLFDSKANASWENVVVFAD
ncbi:class F sortase [Rhodococcus sp. BH5]|uniref:class F sortase n=1 Tax=Rhodococcus sp. BH5 TaxID=2871702 RepID=UPI0022CD4463|nr:class F sortase [Rhodococcus sp. BH5]MCZ9635188.1 class F sortase [Rhodococcus sp. BH5]